MSFRNIRDESIEQVANAAERLALLPTDGTVVSQLDNHTLYIYNASTSTWIPVGSGGGGNPTIGQPVIGASPNKFLYTDGAGDLTQDPGAFRDPSLGFNTELQNETRAGGWDNNGTEYFEALEYGPIGNSIFLVFNGFANCTSVVNSWNIANPNNTVTQTVGSGATVLPAQTITLTGGGGALFRGAESTLFTPASQGAGVEAFDTTNNLIGVNRVGSLPFLDYTPGTYGFFNAAIGNGYIAANAGETNLSPSASLFSIVSDSITFQTGLLVSPNTGSQIVYNGAGLGVVPTGDSYFRDSAGNDFFFPNTGALPSVGQVLGVISTGPNTATLGFISSAGIPNGNANFQYWRWNNSTNTQLWDQVFIATGGAGNTMLGQRAGGLSESANPYGYSYANVCIGNDAGLSIDPALSNPSDTSRNVVIGAFAANNVNSVYQSIVLGYQAYIGGTGTIQQSILLTPDTAGGSNPVRWGIAIGQGAKAEGSYNTAIGFGALTNINGVSASNTALGQSAGSFLGTSGTASYNTMVGANAGANATTGNWNTYLGSNSGNSSGAIDGSIALGAQTEFKASNQLAIGQMDVGPGPNYPIFSILINGGETDVSSRNYNLTFPFVQSGNTDFDGGIVTIDCGGGTGVGIPSSFGIRVSAQDPISGSTQQTQGEVFYCTGIQNVFFGDWQGQFNGTNFVLDDFARSVVFNAANTAQFYGCIIRADALHNNPFIYGNANDQEVRSGTYTPTGYSVANVSSLTMFPCQFLRVGNVVTVSGKVNVTSTSNNTATMVGIDLPIYSGLLNDEEVAGTCHASNATKIHGVVHADVVNLRAELDFDSGTGGTHDMFFHFTYVVLN